jgi:hypothetical protein
MMRYTFAICVACGVQSPPVIIDKTGVRVAMSSLKEQGWRIRDFQYHISAVCPFCLQRAKDEAKVAGVDAVLPGVPGRHDDKLQGA